MEAEIQTTGCSAVQKCPEVIRNELPLPLKIRVTEVGDITFIHKWIVTCIKMYIYSAWCLHNTWS
jgi:hypothetical protein